MMVPLIIRICMDCCWGVVCVRLIRLFLFLRSLESFSSLQLFVIKFFIRYVFCPVYFEHYPVTHHVSNARSLLFFCFTHGPSFTSIKCYASNIKHLISFSSLLCGLMLDIGNTYKADEWTLVKIL